MMRDILFVFGLAFILTPAFMLGMPFGSWELLSMVWGSLIIDLNARFDMLRELEK